MASIKQNVMRGTNACGEGGGRGTRCYGAATTCESSPAARNHPGHGGQNMKTKHSRALTHTHTHSHTSTGTANTHSPAQHHAMKTPWQAAAQLNESNGGVRTGILELAVSRTNTKITRPARASGPAWTRRCWSRTGPSVGGCVSQSQVVEETEGFRGAAADGLRGAHQLLQQGCGSGRGHPGERNQVETERTERVTAETPPDRPSTTNSSRTAGSSARWHRQTTAARRSEKTGSNKLKN